MYCVGAPATHYFPVSIPYHGCALNITVQSYLDQLDFGLIACSETVPDAQRIADFIVEDFAAMRKADAELSGPEAIETIAVAARPASVAAHKPIELAEAEAEPRAPKAEKASALTQHIDALGEATEALLRKLEKTRPAAPARTRAAKAKTATPQKRAGPKPSAAERVSGEEAPARPTRTRSRRARPPDRRRADSGVKVQRRRDPSRSAWPTSPATSLRPQPCFLLWSRAASLVLRGSSLGRRSWRGRRAARLTPSSFCRASGRPTAPPSRSAVTSGFSAIRRLVGIAGATSGLPARTCRLWRPRSVRFAKRPEPRSASSAGAAAASSRARRRVSRPTRRAWSSRWAVRSPRRGRRMSAPFGGA